MDNELFFLFANVLIDSDRIAVYNWKYELVEVFYTEEAEE